MEPGQYLQRIGGAGGKFVSDISADPLSISLFYDKLAYIYHPNYYIVNEPITVTYEEVIPCFGLYGRGCQYLLQDEISKLIDSVKISILN